ncbi:MULTISPECIES: FUSC family protein [Legionella]|uniref:FUSC family protein n=1 Tax=Legionella resiliens TaxID=2905958 RepID=A0ABS8X1Z5_9GAMM|nr:MULTISPECIES: FUSC family protein [unclassified Legionella]MCE0723602.1 FUSC family protein [Legionella sp. 9fVS26]MCE3532756.1 FUSC family protein [Legionella sp. 8cVS16]QLZ68891.1 FUSC family protein [Legionella sp. PC1000]
MSLFKSNFSIEMTSQKTIMAARMAIGAIISFIVTTYFTLVEPTWVYISLFIILFEQHTIGASLTRCSMRAFATISSALYSLIIIFLFHNNYLMNLIGLIIGIFLYTYLFLGTKKSYIGILGCVTLAICLINYNNFSYVFIRPTNVIIGILIGFFTLRFFFPNRATKMLILEMEEFLAEYAALSTYIANIDDSTDLAKRLTRCESNILTLIPHFQTLISEAQVEIGKDSGFTQVAADILQSFRHIFRYYASIIALILYEGVRLNEKDKEYFIFLSNAMIKLKENLSYLDRKPHLVAVPDVMPQKGENLLSLMLSLLVTECSSLEIKINKLIRMAKVVN